MVEPFDTFGWINVHELHLRAAVDGSLRIGSAPAGLTEIKHSIFEKLWVKQVQEMHIDAGSLIWSSKFICQVSVL